MVLPREIAEKLGFESKKVVDNLLYWEKHKQTSGIPKVRVRKPAKTLQNTTKNKTDTTRKAMSVCCLKFNFNYHKGLFCTVRTKRGSSMVHPFFASLGARKGDRLSGGGIGNKKENDQ